MSEVQRLMKLADDYARGQEYARVNELFAEAATTKRAALEAALREALAEAADNEREAIASHAREHGYE